MKKQTTKHIGKLAILFIGLVAIANQTIHAQEYKEKEHSASLELDPAAFILKGYSFSLKYSNEKLPNWSVMVSGFAGNYPNSLLAESNKSRGWTDLKFRCSNALFVDYHIKPSRKGLFFGPSVFSYKNEVKNSTTNQTISFRTIYPNVRVGYNWFPFKKLDLYLSPWINVGKEFSIDKNNISKGIEYSTAQVKYVAALHIGYNYRF
jgi:hypothetical protein